MKRIVTLVLALAMLAGALTVTAGAAYLTDYTNITANTANNDDSAGIEAGTQDTTGTLIDTQDVTVKYQTTSGGGLINVYAVSIDKTELTFTWSNSASTIWNPETLAYETDNNTGSWSNASQDLTIYNYSDVKIKVEAANTNPTTEDSNVTVTVGGPLELDAAYNPSGDNEVKSGTISVTVDGTPTIAPGVRDLATITLNITRNEDVTTAP